MSPFEKVDALVHSDRYLPRWGWHDDHKGWDGTSEYLPALMQVRSEYAAFVRELEEADVLGGKCLQLGMGECHASHNAWQLLFKHVRTISFGDSAVDDLILPLGNTHDEMMLEIASRQGLYDMLFIDAGHDYEDARLDYEMYGPLVRPGGVIAFHDALKRPRFEEVEVWRFLETLKGVRLIGAEVGIGWLVR